MKTTIRTIALAALVAIASLSQTVIAQTGSSPPPRSMCLSHSITGRSTSRPASTPSPCENQNILTLRSGNRSAWAMIQAGYDPTPAQIRLCGLPQVRRPLLPHGIRPDQRLYSRIGFRVGCRTPRSARLTPPTTSFPAASSWPDLRMPAAERSRSEISNPGRS